MTAASPPHSQTLSRGIRALELMADSPGPMTIVEIATALDVHRSIAYRILRTLEDHRLIRRDTTGAFSLATKMAVLARNVARSLQSTAIPELTSVANELEMTAFLAVLDDTDCVTLSSVEPRTASAALAQRPGTRHSLALGAPGIAIQSLLSDAELGELKTVRRNLDEAGYATSHDEVIPGLRSVAVPLLVTGSPPAALSVVYFSTDRDTPAIASVLKAAARSITQQLG